MKSVSSDFATAFQQPTMEVKARVIMQFGDNSFNSSSSTFDPLDPTSTDDQRCTASSTKLVHRRIDGSYQSDTVNFWSPVDVFNNKNRNSMRWAVCDSGAKAKDEEAIDCFRAIDIDDNDPLGSPAYERGWWSASRSDGSGTFGSPEWVQTVWDDPRPINRITLYTMEGYDNMKSVTVQYYSGGWTTVATYSLGLTEYIKTWDFDSVVCTGLRVYFNSTQNASDYARCNELQGYFVQDISDDIINANIDQQKEEYVNTVPVGITKANLANLTLQNIDQQYSPGNTSSAYYPYIEANNRFTVEYGIKRADHTYEYTPMGEFWVDEWHVDGSSLNATVSSRDFSKFLQDQKIFNLGKVWQNTKIGPVIRDVLARAGKCPDEIFIDATSDRKYQILFLKDKSFWVFMTEIGFADQSTYGFDESGNFVYETYAAINNAPNNTPRYHIDADTNLVSATEPTELYINSVIVKLSQYRTANLAFQKLWEATPADTLDISNATTQSAITDTTTVPDGTNVVLSWNFLSAGINSTTTTIPVSLNNTTQNFDLNYGYLLIDNELIHYQDRTDTSFTNCTRGFGNTSAASHTNNTLIGRAKYWEIEWTNGPATEVKYPYSSAIDALLIDENEGTPQAAIVLFTRSAFGGKLAVGNTVPYYTILRGKGRSQKVDDPQLDWNTEIVGKVAVQKGAQEEIGGITGRTVSVGRAVRYIRRYGKNEIVIDNPWIQTREHAIAIREIYLQEYKVPRQLINLKIVGYPALELNDRIQIDSYPQLFISNKQYNVISAQYSYDGSLMCDMLLREVRQ